MSEAATVSAIDRLAFWGWKVIAEEQVTAKKPWPKPLTYPTEYHTSGHAVRVQDGCTSTWGYGETREKALENMVARVEAETCKIFGCVECGRNEARSWDGECEKHLKVLGMCFTCGHWADLLAVKDAPTTVRVKGRHYTIAPDQPPHERYFSGHGGDVFNIRFHDGRNITSRNLWCQGEIPPHFRDRLSDNAVFAAPPTTTPRPEDGQMAGR